MQKRIFIIVWFLSVSFLIQAQLGKEAWHWQFGQHTALDFSSGLPIVDTSAVNTDEGCASISNPNTGQLLFYTDGISVWNRFNQQMPNGDSLFGNWTTSQSALIVPKPGTKNLFYVFTCDYDGQSHGVCYTLVDMNLDGGKGDVVIGAKNTTLTPAPAAEKLTAVRQCNGIDFWVIDHPLNSSHYNAYSVTPAGINSVPVVSNIGAYLNNTGTDGYGCLKGSPDGKRLAAGGQYIRKLEIFKFNNSTGFITSPITINFPFTIQGAYGVSFSPDNSKLYATDMYNKLLYQCKPSSNHVLFNLS
jgi:WD40 repeat protein